MTTTTRHVVDPSSLPSRPPALHTVVAVLSLDRWAGGRPEVWSVAAIALGGLWAHWVWAWVREVPVQAFHRPRQRPAPPAPRRRRFEDEAGAWPPVTRIQGVPLGAGEGESTTSAAAESSHVHYAPTTRDTSPGWPSPPIPPIGRIT